MSQLQRDARQSLRSLQKSPGYSLVAVLTLALGIGATTAIYTVIQSVLLEPLPYPQAERILVIQEKNPEAGLPRFSISPLNFRDYREMSTSFSAMAASTRAGLSLTAGDGRAPRLLDARTVTADYLEVFGVSPNPGRGFTAEDDRPGAPPVILVSRSVWQSLGGGEDLVGQDLVVDGVPTTLIGILPPELPSSIDALVPLRLDYDETGRGSHWLIAHGRPKDGVSLAEAERELETVAANLEQAYPDSNTGWSSLVAPLQERMVENVELALWVLLAAVGLVLLIACANVANLTLARLASREREVALRSSLGAGRGQLMRQMLTESAVLALISGSLGVLLAVAGTRWLVSSGAADLPRSGEISIDAGVLAFALVVTLFSAFAFGFLPALQASRPDLSGALKEGGRGQAGGQRGQRLRDVLVLAEVALAVVVLIGAGLLLRSFANLLAVDPGFSAEGLWSANVSLPETRYAEDEQRFAFFQQLHEQMSAIPGVEHATTVYPMPLVGGSWVNVIYLDGEPLPAPNEERSSIIHFVNADFFDTLGIALVKGRGIDRRDTEQAEKVLVANRSAAEELWPGENPIGKRISFGTPGEEGSEWYTVVGVSGDVRQSLDATVAPVLYRSVYQGTPPSAALVLRTSAAPGSLAQPLRDVLHRLDPLLPLERERTGTVLLESSTAEPRFNATLLGLFAALALVLSAIGVFGVVSYAVAQRRRELGVRVALGAQASQIMQMVLRSGLGPVLLGIVAGLLSAFAATRLLHSLVFEVGTGDPLTFAAVAGLLTAVAALACLQPAWRATRIDPIKVLHED